MDYKDSYGKTVKVNVDIDLEGYKIDTSLNHVVTFYMDKRDAVVGIYPLEEDGYTKKDLLSFQPVKHEVFVEDLEEV